MLFNALLTQHGINLDFPLEHFIVQHPGNQMISYME